MILNGFARATRELHQPKDLKINSNHFSIKLKRHEASSIAVKIPEMFQVKFEKMAKPI